MEAQKPFNIYLQPYCRGFFAMLLQLKEDTGTADSSNLCTCSFTNVSLREIVCQRSEDLVEQVKSHLLVWLESVYGQTLCRQKDWNNLSNVVFLKELLPIATFTIFVRKNTIYVAQRSHPLTMVFVKSHCNLYFLGTASISSYPSIGTSSKQVWSCSHLCRKYIYLQSSHHTYKTDSIKFKVFYVTDDLYNFYINIISRYNVKAILTHRH